MAFNGAFTIAATAGVPGSVTLTDTSTGTDANLTGRTITMYDAAGDIFYTGSWAIGDTTKTIDLLDIDKALNVKVDWASSSPLADPSTYTLSLLFASVVYLMEQFCTMTRLQASNPNIMRDKQYYEKKYELLVEIKGAEYGISEMEDIVAAQECIERAQFLITNKSLFY
jgi:hypothetical protein